MLRRAPHARGFLRRAAPARYSPLARLPRFQRGPHEFGRALSIKTLSVDDLEQISARSEALHKEFLVPLNKKWLGPLDKNYDQLTKLPFVFILGNHSSGKSTFINYVLGRDVQVAGVAPTDDGFTVIAPGDADSDQDGPSLIGDPDMGFAGMRRFGLDLIHRTQLKVRKDLKYSNFMMVDSPGMIDSPGMYQDGRGKARAHDRGYDFEGVTRWLAQRADVILLFFDPDKPGTTGETLTTLTNSLTDAGVDHKLHIILNKADQFEKIHDFARAYGSLCWNLSQVIKRKDMPRIYTMCVPRGHRKGTAAGGDDAAGGGDHGMLSTLAQDDLTNARNEVVMEVGKAPERRVDNIITRLHDHTYSLQMHVRVGNRMRRAYSNLLWSTNLTTAAVGTVGLGASGFCLYNLAPAPLLGAVVAISLLGLGGTNWYGNKLLVMKYRELLSVAGMREQFELEYLRQIMEEDEYVQSIWERVHPHLAVAAKTSGLRNLPSLSSGEKRRLNFILEEEVPDLRRMASPLKQTMLEKMKESLLGGGEGEG